MRYAIYLLLVANLAFFAWLYRTHEQYAPPAGPVVAALPATVESLRLLRERGADTRPVQREDRRGAAQEASQPPVPAPAPAEEVAVFNTAAGVPLPESVEPGGETISDAGQDAAVVVAGTEATPEQELPPQPPPTPVRVCQTIGPFLARRDAERLVNELADAGPQAVIRVSQMQQPNGYWVFLPEMERGAARRTVRELQSKGVEDYYLGRQNVISLGLFSDRRTAEARRREIAVMGYEPRVEERLKSRDMYWVDLEEQEPSRVSDERWRTLLGPLADIRRQSVSCE